VGGRKIADAGRLQQPAGRGGVRNRREQPAPPPRGEYRAVEAELENIRTGWSYVTAADPRNHELVRKYMAAMDFFLGKRGYWDERRAWLEEHGRACEALGDRKGLTTTYNNIGEIHRARGDYAAALEWYEKNVAIKEKLGD
jgi:tetratricopeptide (TPR) repeat protein